MNKNRKYAIRAMLTVLMTLIVSISVYRPIYAYASDDGQEYITISVEAQDDNGTLLYALDTDEPSAFSTSNEFSVPAGTRHTIYVKDAAGNITSQQFTPSETDGDNTDMLGETEKGRTVNIDVLLDDTDYSDYEYAGDIPVNPAEEGQGTVYDRVETTMSDPDAERLFYTVTTDEGEVFYLVIDQGQTSNNVYLLDQVNLSDLHALAMDDTRSSETEESNSLLSALSSETENVNDELISENSSQDTASKKENSTAGSLIIALIIGAAGGGFYYYKTVYKNKRNEQMDLIDAPDKDDFMAADEDDEDEVDFGLDEDYQDKLMAQLLDEDEDELEEQEMTDKGYAEENKYFEESEELPDSSDTYATSHKEYPEPEEPVDEDEYDDELDGEEDDE